MQLEQLSCLGLVVVYTQQILYWEKGQEAASRGCYEWRRASRGEAFLLVPCRFLELLFDETEFAVRLTPRRLGAFANALRSPRKPSAERDLREKLKACFLPGCTMHTGENRWTIPAQG